jgi:nucleoside-diphosphate-sugar epimerase
MKLLFGCGYLGSRVAALWQAAGERVTIVTRDSAKADALRLRGYEAIVADVCEPATLESLPEAKTVLFAVGYDRRAPQRTIGEVYAQGVRNVLDAVRGSGFRVQGSNASEPVPKEDPASANPEPRTSNPEPLFIYVSSTGVYGDADGDWVDETTPCRPLREGGKACLAAEAAIANHQLASRSVVLRLAGIYGPDRIPRGDALRRGEPIDAPAEGYLNLIHVDDAARIVLDVEIAAAAGKIATPQTYCVADGHPGMRRDYYAELAQLLEAPPPRFVEPSPSSPAAARAAADKRISNVRLLRDVAPKLRYPSFRDGLAAIVRGR